MKSDTNENIDSMHLKKKEQTTHKNTFSINIRLNLLLSTDV